MHLPTLYYILGLVEVTTNHLKKKKGSKPKRRSLFAKARRRREGGRRLLHILYLAPFSSPFQRTSERKVTSCWFFLQLVMQWCLVLVYALLCFVMLCWKALNQRTPFTSERERKRSKLSLSFLLN